VIAMPLCILLLEQFVEWKYGVLGAIALLLLGIGRKSHNSTCTGVGAVFLALLLIQPSFG
jgi:hypothetical protein